MNQNRGQFGYGSIAEERHDSPTLHRAAVPLASQNAFAELADSISGNIFTINNSATTLERVLKQLGTDKDSSDVRKKVHETEERTNRIITETASQLKRLQTIHSKAERAQRFQVDRLMGEFKESTQKYHSLQTRVADRAKTTTPPSGSTTLAANKANLIDFNESEANDSSVDEQRRRQTQIERETLETDVALLQERENQIRQLEGDILDINEIFRELGTLVHEQGTTIDSIEANVESTETNVHLGNQQLERAALYQNKARKRKCCLIAVVLIVIAVVVVIIVVVTTKNK